ncbi:PilT/PilU family type 4a pilus ATPase [Pelagibaculum spongiae]|uniref:Type IV pili twitching motility protein PilT n=1 Tax=Pelagibaculum spongiae TaxID=2080658 RepID=A0A2V1H6W1_9GAMM|nr:PilT/PilU family type 4a pilus ATPase [Pelagibaculum spongiae]PVZ72172.1 type IV pili twitching motility protein PilT [Pelagibaculum spongiae]
MDFESLLRLMVEKKASDLFITAGASPSLKIHGKLVPVTRTTLPPDKARDAVLSLMTEDQQKTFSRTKECNFALSAAGIGRFRVSAFQQRNQSGMVLRRIEHNIPTLEELSLPPQIKDIAMARRGLVIVAGATGSGKTTSLAAMIGYRNQNSSGHIIAIEDPIEFIHQHGQCIVTQREVGLDTDSFETALKNSLRQAPDVIQIGEIRSRETMEYALAFAETGHLCLATLHANNANQALDRIINFFPEDRHRQICMDLSLNLKGIVGIQLLPALNRKGRCPVVEILLNTPLMSDMIRNGEFHQMKELMKKSTENGMQTFDQALYRLYQGGEIAQDVALHHADSVNDLRLMIKMGDVATANEEDGAESAADAALSGLELVDDKGLHF